MSTIEEWEADEIYRIEHKRFEKWLMDYQGLQATWNPIRSCYVEFPAHLAWKAWCFSPTNGEKP